VRGWCESEFTRELPDLHTDYTITGSWAGKSVKKVLSLGTNPQSGPPQAVAVASLHLTIVVSLHAPGHVMYITKPRATQAPHR
jgi:hypothetical protein